jgi:hypothetical protein
MPIIKDYVFRKIKILGFIPWTVKHTIYRQSYPKPTNENFLNDLFEEAIKMYGPTPKKTAADIFKSDYEETNKNDNEEVNRDTPAKA